MSRVITFLDDNDYIKKLRGLKRYNMRAYKYIMFHLKDDIDNQEEGKHIKNLYTDNKFKKVYGQVQIVYTIKNNVAIIENILPDEFLLDGYMVDLKTYIGVPYRNKQDLFKIQMLEKIGAI